MYLSQGKKPNAEEVLKQAKRDFPDEPAGYRLLADFYFTTGDMEKATAEYGALYQEHPENIRDRTDDLIVANSNTQTNRQREGVSASCMSVTG